MGNIHSANGKNGSGFANDMAGIESQQSSASPPDPGLEIQYQHQAFPRSNNGRDVDPDAMSIPKIARVECTCLKQLTHQLCLLNAVERDHRVISLDMILSKTNWVLSCSQNVLECPSCRLDSKAVLLVMMLLQMVFNWAKAEYSQNVQPRQHPAIYFGNWKVSEEDGELVRRLLSKRTLTISNTVVNIVRLRIDEICVTSKHESKYQTMDVSSLRPTLQQLTVSLAELAWYIEHSAKDGDYDGAPNDQSRQLGRAI